MRMKFFNYFNRSSNTSYPFPVEYTTKSSALIIFLEI